MKKQASIWIVLSFLLLAIGIVYALTTSTPPDTASATGNPQAIPVQGSAQENTLAVNPQPESSLSPDLSKVDAYQFLDPVAVGKAAPNFKAVTAEGKPIQLSQFKGKKNLVLVFYQGSFCSVCGAQLTNLQKHISDFKAQDTEIIAISADDKMHAIQSVAEHGLTFPVVPDEKKQIIDQFGIANMHKKGIAWPSLFVVDKKGVVRVSYADHDGHRLHSGEILPELAKISGKPAPILGYND